MRLRATRLNAIGNRRRGWTPAVLGSALALWLDAEDAASITLNGSKVSEWRDKSGNNRNASQGVAANQPTYTTSGLNGKPVLTFNGNQRMAKSFSVAAPYENWFVLRINGSPGTYIFRDGIDESINRVFMVINSIGHVTIGSESNTLLSTGEGFSFPYGSPSIMGGVYNNSSSSIVFNGTVVATGAAGTVTTNGLTIGGRYSGEQFNMNGFYAEHILTNSILSTTDRQRLEGYLAHKWGLAANLPAGHPFNLTPPTV